MRPSLLFCCALAGLLGSLGVAIAQNPGPSAPPPDPNTVKLIGDRFKPAGKELDELAAGEGGIVRVRGRKSAAYRDEAGTLHVLSPVCRHLHCHVAWNAAERSWDCPCHGSRYSGEGDVIQGPTVKPLRRLDER